MTTWKCSQLFTRTDHLLPSAIIWSIFLVLSHGKCYCCFFITACKINNNFVNRYGPLVHLWCMRFEGKHKQFKQVAKTNTFKNITKTLAKHHQRLLAYDLHCNPTLLQLLLQLEQVRSLLSRCCLYLLILMKAILTTIM